VSKSKDKGKAKDKENGKEKNGTKPTTVVTKPDQAKDLAKISESGRYACVVCDNHFCIDCDVFAHEVVHNCPGCQSDTRAAVKMQVDAEATQAAGDGNTHANGAMLVD
jgi:transcription initiation factor TFIIH subunit 2